MSNSKQTPKIQYINSALFRERQRKKLSIKVAAAELKISALHLDLIEKGYMRVSKKLQPRFIEFYNLEKDFFEKNSTYVEPIYIKKVDLELDKKMRAQLAKPHVKIVSSILSCIAVGVIIGGALMFTKQYRAPRNNWTKDFTAIRQKVIDLDEEEHFDTALLDTCYSISLDKEDPIASSHITFSTFASDSNATCASFSYEHTYKVEDTRPDRQIKPYDKFKIEAHAYNKKKYININFVSLFGDLANSRVDAVAFFTEPNKFTMKRVTVTTGTEIKDYDETTDIYKRFYTLLFTDNLVAKEIAYSDELIALKIGSAVSPNYRFYEFMNDCLAISRSYVFSYNAGFNMMLFGSIACILFVSNLLFSFWASAKPKKEKKEEVYVVHRVEYTEAVYRQIPNDSNFSPFLPEFSLRILGLLVILLSSIGMIWVTDATINYGASAAAKATQFNNVVSNILVAGTTLLFFIKLDVFHKKTNRELIENILTLFFAGLMFYVAEILVYFYLITGGNLFTEVAKLFTSLIPGNIVWNLMFYSLLFLFLFTIPDKIANKPHKLLLWRLCSVIPTFILLLSFVYEMFLKKYISAPYYISFIFFSKGAVMSAFAILYLYSLFFLQQYIKLKYGEAAIETYLNSRRYAIGKNAIASIVIVVLVLIDLFFRYKMPINSMNLGNNWPIILLIPFIMLYRPHIGKRNGTWDLSYTVMYVIFLAGGYIGAISIFLKALSFGDLAEILH